MEQKNTPVDYKTAQEVIESYHLPDFGKATIREVVAIATELEQRTGTEFIHMEMGVPGLKPAEVGVKAEIAALEQGADDYIVKPFSFRELVARIRAVLRRMGPRTNKMLICGDVRLDGQRKKCYVAGVPHDLTAVQFAIVEKLMSQPGRVFSRQELVSAFSNSFCEEYSRNVDAHIKNIRKILSKNNDGASYIETVRSMGYRFREF